MIGNVLKGLGLFRFSSVLALLLLLPPSTPTASSHAAAPPAPPVMAAKQPAAPPEPPEAPEAPQPPHPRGNRAWLGVMLSGEGEGVVITGISENSPAMEAGLEKGDRILEVDGETVGDAMDVRHAIRKLEPGDKVQIRIERDGKEKTVTATIQKSREREIFRELREFHHGDDSAPPPMPFRMLEWNSRNFLGVHLLDITEDLRAYFKAPRGRGVLVSRVGEETPAAKAGIRAGDVILTVDGTGIGDPGDIRSALEDREPGDRVTVKVVRDGVEKTLEVEIAERPSRKGGRPRSLFLPGGKEFEMEVLPENFEEETRESVEDALEGADAIRWIGPETMHLQIQQAMEEARAAMETSQEFLGDQLRLALERAREATVAEDLPERIREAMEEAREKLDRAREEMERARERMQKGGGSTV